MPDIDQIYLIEHSLLIGLAAVSAAFCYLYLQEYKKRQNLLKKGPEIVVKEAQEKSLSLLHKAFKKAQGILGRAELEGIKTVADTRVLNRKLEGKYEEQFDKRLSSAESEFIKYLGELRVRAEQSQSLNAELTREQSKEIFTRFEGNLANFLAATEQKSIQTIEGEVKATRGMIEQYKAQQLALIDENILSVLEKTLSLVMSKKISLKEEVDLVYEALEKAKGEKFII